MDTAEAGAAQQQQQREPGEKVVRMRGKSSSKQVRCTRGGGRGCFGARVLFSVLPFGTIGSSAVAHDVAGVHAHTLVPAWPLATHRFRCLSAFDSLQKQRKRKSLEKALAVASRTETKVAKTTAKKDGKKGLKKLWSNDSKEDK